jgi:hypothetical protein
MSKRELIKISIRVDREELQKLTKLLGIPDASKCIRASMNFTNNVALNLFGGNLANMFKRKKKNEEVGLYDNSL